VKLHVVRPQSAGGTLAFSVEIPGLKTLAGRLIDRGEAEQFHDELPPDQREEVDDPRAHQISIAQLIAAYQKRSGISSAATLNRTPTWHRCSSLLGWPTRRRRILLAGSNI
jgi:hypothetical protein